MGVTFGLTLGVLLYLGLHTPLRELEKTYNKSKKVYKSTSSKKTLYTRWIQSGGRRRVRAHVFLVSLMSMLVNVRRDLFAFLIEKKRGKEKEKGSD